MNYQSNKSYPVENERLYCLTTTRPAFFVLWNVFLKRICFFLQEERFQYHLILFQLRKVFTICIKEYFIVKRSYHRALLHIIVQ